MPRARPHPTFLSAVIAVVASGLIFAPVISFVVGRRGEAIVNRSPRAFPGRDSGWNWVTQLSLALSDRLPLRGSAVRADGWIDQQVFGEDPAYGGASMPDVVAGIDGYLFVTEDFQRACLNGASPETVVALLAAIAATLESSGRETVVGIAPNKSSVLSDRLPLHPPGEECHRDFTSRLWTALEAAAIPQYVDLLGALLEQRTATGRPMYHRLDTHWDMEGALVAVRTIIERLDPGLWDESEVFHESAVDKIGDLTVIQGNPRTESAPAVVISRDGVVPVNTSRIPDGYRFTNSAPPNRLIAGRTVIVLDSFGLGALPLLLPYFEDLTVVEFTSLSGEHLVPYLVEADNVILLSVERFFEQRMTDHFNAAFLDALTTALEQ